MQDFWNEKEHFKTCGSGNMMITALQWSQKKVAVGLFFTLHHSDKYENQRRWYRKVCTSNGTSRKGLSIDLETVYRSFFVVLKCTHLGTHRKENIFMKRYGYHRTSTREQHLDWGIAEITAYCEQNQLELERIFTDQQTGKDFNRPRYQVLKEDVLRSGDELIITEVDRLGRNKRDTLKELQYFRDHNIRVKILELPTTLMDISKLDNTMA